LENAPTLGLYPPLKSLFTFFNGLLIRSPILMKLGLLISKPQFEVVLCIGEGSLPMASPNLRIVYSLKGVGLKIKGGLHMPSPL
jgi:hypothetical protein